MSPEQQAKFKEMEAWFDQVKTGGRIIKWAFALFMAIGSAYLLVKQILH